MFIEKKVVRLGIPGWEAVYKAEIMPGIISFIAVHDTSRGIALGGCRMADYDSESRALTDVLRLSRGMTFKNTAADLPLGGGKAIIVCEPKISGKKRQRVLAEFGKFVAYVNKRKSQYITAEDMNTTVKDMNIIKDYTKHICGTLIDPSPYTAHGVFAAMEYAVDYFAMDLFHGDRSLTGKKILIQGIGKVGGPLLEKLHGIGADIYIADIRKDVIKTLRGLYPDIKVVAPRDIFKHKFDIFSPCAKGEVISNQNIMECRHKIICGAANNQLQNPNIGEMIHKEGIAYCPDYVVNMGGVCSIQFVEFDKLEKEAALNKIRRTVRKMLALTFRTAFRKNLSFTFALDHAVTRIIFSHTEAHLEFSNKKIFPFASSIELDYH